MSSACQEKLNLRDIIPKGLKRAVFILVSTQESTRGLENVG